MAISKKQPRDLNRLAHSIMEEATIVQAGLVPGEDSEKNLHAVGFGWLGGNKGGKNRGKEFTRQERSDFASVPPRQSLTPSPIKGTNKNRVTGKHGLNV